MSRECCVLSGRGLCGGLIPRPAESYRLWCVVECDLETLVNEEGLAHGGLSRQIKKKKLVLKFSVIGSSAVQCYGFWNFK
jgi:hypothetical protein